MADRARRKERQSTDGQPGSGGDSSPLFVQPRGNASMQEELLKIQQARKDKEDKGFKSFSPGGDTSSMQCLGYGSDKLRGGLCSDKDTGKNMMDLLKGADPQRPFLFGIGINGTF